MKRLITKKELAQYLRLSVFTVDTCVSQNRIPYIKIGRRVLFDLADIDAWLQHQKVPPEKKLDLGKTKS